MTWVQNRLVYPDGTPVRGRLVVATLMAGPSWIACEGGRAVGSAETHTDGNGLWQLQLMPYTQAEPPADEAMYYRVDEGEQQWNIRVPAPPNPEPDDWPPNQPWEPFWLRHLVVDPPPPKRQEWRLGGLADVSGVPATDGDVLTWHQGQWEPATLPVPTTELAALTDVDSDSVENAAVGSVLTYLGGGLWGAVLTDDIPDDVGTLVYQLTYDTTDTTGHTVVLSLTERADAVPVTVDWDDGSDPDLLDDATSEVTHRYSRGGTYSPYVAYEDGSEVGTAAPGTSGSVEIPNPGGTHAMTTNEVTPDTRPGEYALTVRVTAGLHAQVKLDGHVGNYAIYWGDSDNATGQGGRYTRKARPYPHAGVYTITACKYGDPKTVYATKTVHVREAIDVQVELVDATERLVALTFPDDADAAAATRAELFWDFDDETTEAVTVWTTPGATLTHAYPDVGSYNLVLRDRSTGINTRVPVEVTAPTFDPDGVFTQQSDGWTLRFTMNTDARDDVLVDWGTGFNEDSEVMTRPKAGAYVEHTYSEAPPDWMGAYATGAYYVNEDSANAPGEDVVPPWQ